jgi:RimJ/RimL family protein N-acetyltransferase
MYKCLKKNSFKDEWGYQLVPIRQEDIENIRLWRNAQMEVLRQKVILTSEAQKHYFQRSVWPTFQQTHPNQILFSFLLDEKCIGYGGLTYLDWENSRAEVSFLVDPIRAQDSHIYPQDFSHFLNLLCQVTFEELHLHRLLSETFAFRHSTLAVFKQHGFKQEGVLREHIYKQEQWYDSILLALLATDWELEKNRSDVSLRVPKQSAVLITSISKKMPLIEAVRQATKKLGHFQQLHGCDSQAFCIGQYGVDEFWHCLPLEEMKAEDVIAYCQENKITAIIPTRDADVEFYARHVHSFREKGIFPMVSSLETVTLCQDKRAFADFLLQHRFSVIPSYLSLEEFESSFYVVKERKGAGSHQIALRLSREEAIKHANKLEDPLFQPFIEGQEWSIDLYRSFAGEVKGCVARQRNYVMHGESQVTTTLHHPLLEHLCHEMANALKIEGHAVFQVIEDAKGDYHIVECNPRFGGASTASIAVGLDSFFWFFAECLGLNLHKYPFLRSKEEVRQVRYPTDRVLPWSSSLI